VFIESSLWIICYHNVNISSEVFIRGTFQNVGKKLRSCRSCIADKATIWCHLFVCSHATNDLQINFIFTTCIIKRCCTLITWKTVVFLDFNALTGFGFRLMVIEYALSVCSKKVFQRAPKLLQLVSTIYVLWNSKPNDATCVSTAVSATALTILHKEVLSVLPVSCLYLKVLQKTWLPPAERESEIKHYLPHCEEVW